MQTYLGFVDNDDTGVIMHDVNVFRTWIVDDVPNWKPSVRPFHSAVVVQVSRKLCKLLLGQIVFNDLKVIEKQPT